MGQIRRSFCKLKTCCHVCRDLENTRCDVFKTLFLKPPPEITKSMVAGHLFFKSMCSTQAFKLFGQKISSTAFMGIFGTFRSCHVYSDAFLSLLRLNNGLIMITLLTQTAESIFTERLWIGFVESHPNALRL